MAILDWAFAQSSIGLRFSGWFLLHMSYVSSVAVDGGRCLGKQVQPSALPGVAGAEGDPPNPARSVEMYGLAIEGWHVSALFILALVLETGADGVPANPARFVRLYERAIEHGRVNAMIKLGTLLQEGRDGVWPDEVRSAELFTRAMHGANVRAAKNLSASLEIGGGLGLQSKVVNLIHT